MTARTLAAEQPRARAASIDRGALGAWTLGFALVGYLALKGGGYDVVVRSQAGIALWWIVLLGVALGVLARQRPGRPAAVALALLGAFAALSALSATWSESPERAMSETARVVTLLGVLMLAVCTVRAEHGRALVSGVFAAIVGVAALACLSRLHPAWFGEPETAEYLTSTRNRLSYGLNYWNALGAFAALGVPLGLAVSMTARTLAGRTAALAAIPVLALTCLFTISRGGVLAAALGTLVILALSPQRGRLAAKVALAGVGTAILVEGALERDALRDGLTTSLARDQGDGLLVIALFTIAGIAFVHWGLGIARAGGLLPEPRPLRPRHARVARGLVALAVLAGGTGLAVAGDLDRRWEDFKQRDVAEAGYSRLGSASGHGRYNYWASAVEAFKSAPVTGLGAGSFENWWQRNARHSETLRNAHSLYAETLAELGLLGLVPILGLMLLVIGTGARRALRATGPPAMTLAGATAACAAFAVATGLDWHWQVTVLPACFLLLAAVVLAPGGRPRAMPGLGRGLIAAVALVAIVALVFPLAGTTQLRASQRAAAADQLDPALKRARTAGRAQPYAASPELQRALVLERRGDLAAAVGAALEAQRKEPTSWRPPFVLARLHAARGDGAAAVKALDRARSLNKTASFLR